MKRPDYTLFLAIFSLSIMIISCSDIKRDTSIPTNSVSKYNSPYSCNTCHGNETNDAPPRDLQGNTSTSSPGVGAHQAHLTRGVACNECHIVPVFYNDPGHLDVNGGADVVFQGSVGTGALAHVSGADVSAIYTKTNLTCENTYCHGNIPNGNKTAPLWTDQTGQHAACGSCHGNVAQSSIGNKALPKTSLNGGTHPNNTNCSQCHTSAINSNYQLNAAKHINGKLDYVN